MELKSIIREYFTFTRGERNGLMVLLVIMIIFVLAGRLFVYFEKPGQADRERFERLMLEFEKNKLVQQTRLSLFPFDPNTVDSIALDSLELPSRIKQNILRYRLHGGSFKKREDVRRIYGMNDSIYAAIEKYLDIGERKVVQIAGNEGGQNLAGSTLPEITTKSGNRALSVEEEDASGDGPGAVPVSGMQAAPGRAERGAPANAGFKTLLIIELNTATAADLKKLYGIGEVLSERIVKYRNLLGGFSSLEQLNEVYGLNSETENRIRGQLRLDSTSIVKININFAEVGELARHPYLNWTDAREIINYREQTGFINNKTQLLQDSVISKEIFEKISPYLEPGD